MSLKIPLLFLIIIANCKLYAQPKPSFFSFEKQVFDFGEIQEKDGITSYTFNFKNTGNSPLIINQIVSGCSCTSFNYTKKPVAPGENGIVTVTYNPSYRPGFFSKEIVVVSNDKENTARLWIKGSVVPFNHPVEEDYPYDFGKGLHLNLKVLSFGKIKAGGQKTIVLRYANNTDSEMTLHFVVENKKSNLLYTNPGKLEPMNQGKISFIYKMPAQFSNDLSETIYPVVNGQKLAKPLSVKAIVIE